jgi:hypothetical protein
MASRTSLFTGPPLTAGVDAPAIEYPATGDQPQQDIQQRYSASMGEYFTPICVGRPKLDTLRRGRRAARHT